MISQPIRVDKTPRGSFFLRGLRFSQIPLPFTELTECISGGVLFPNYLGRATMLQGNTLTSLNSYNDELPLKQK